MAFGWAGAAAGANDALQQILQERLAEQYRQAVLAGQEAERAQEAARFEASLGLQRDQFRANQDTQAWTRQRAERQDRTEETMRGLDIMAKEAALRSPPPPPRTLPLRVRGANGRPVFQQFEEGDPRLAAGEVEAYEAPRDTAPSAADYVTLASPDGTLRQVTKGPEANTLLAQGWTLYEKETSGGFGMANVRLRNSRIATALNSVERLKKLAPVRTPGPLGLVEGAMETAKSWVGMNPPTRQFHALLEPTAMQMAVAVQSAANLSDSERKAMAGMLGSIATMDYESQMGLLEMATDALSKSGDVMKVGETWVPVNTKLQIGGGGGTQGSMTVIDPVGKTHVFATQAQADAFRRLIEK